MAGFQFTCPCGHQIKVDAGNRNEAVSKIQGVMDEKAIAAHFKEKHPCAYQLSHPGVLVMEPAEKGDGHD